MISKLFWVCILFSNVQLNLALVGQTIAQFGSVETPWGALLYMYSTRIIQG
jgi:hypothetical protein